MRVMVTGATGFFGGHVLRALQAAGHTPVALVRSEDKLAQVAAIHGLDGPVDHVVGDILDADSVARALQGADACVHAAAYTTLDPALMHHALAVNGPGAELVLTAAVRAGCDPVVHVSSSSCVWPPTGERCDPDLDPVHSSDAPYPRSKAEAELCARGLADDGHPVAILYPAGVTGPDDAGFNIMSMVIAGVMSADFLVSAATGGWSIVDVRDLATATVGLLGADSGGRRYMAMGNTVDWATFNAAITAVTGRERAIVEMTRAQLLENLDEEAVDIMLGIKPGKDGPLLHDGGVGTWRPLHETLTDTTRWLLAHGHLASPWAPALA